MQTYLNKQNNFHYDDSADLLLVNGRIYTVDEHFTVVSQMAVRDGKIVYTGNNFKSKAKETIDLQGKCVYPGFIDGHCHFVYFGETLVRYINLKGCSSFNEVIERLQQHNNNDSNWIIGQGWDQNLWTSENGSQPFPDNKMLNQLFPDKYILLSRVDGHAVLVNDNILNLINMNKESGNPKGILLDNDADIAKAAIAPLTDVQLKTALLKAESVCFDNGLSSITDAGLDKHTILTIKKLQDEGIMKIKVNAMANPDSTFDFFINQGKLETDRLKVQSVKLYTDGALGSRGAKLLQPYTDSPETEGFIVKDDSFYRQICRKAIDTGFQVCTHAIGDGGVRHTLDIYSEFLSENNDLRWRIEHSQIVDSTDFQRYGKLNIIPSIQATHCIDDMSWAEKFIGKQRIRNAYPYKRLLNENNWLVNGTDFPWSSMNPVITFYSSVARQDIDGNPKEGFQPHDALTREQALRSITIWAAKGQFEENVKGSLETGKCADFVILSEDLMTAPLSQIPNTEMLSLYINGEKIR